MRQLRDCLYLQKLQGQGVTDSLINIHFTCHRAPGVEQLLNGIIADIMRTDTDIFKGLKESEAVIALCKCKNPVIFRIGDHVNVAITA